MRAGVKEISPGDAVRVVDEKHVEHVGLVTWVHGGFDGVPGRPDFVPCINVVYVSKDSTKSDPYGLQLERMSSLQHLSEGPLLMPMPGRFWENLK